MILAPNVIELGIVATKPPEKVNASDALSPNTKVPVFAKVTTLVKEFVDPVRLTL